MRERENRFIKDFSEVINDNFAGKWITVEGRAVVTSDVQQFEAVNRARVMGINIPYTLYIDTPEERNTPFLL